MKRIILIVFLIFIASSVFPKDLNESGSVSVYIDLIGLFYKNINTGIEYRFTEKGSAQLNLGYINKDNKGMRNKIYIEPVIKLYMYGIDTQYNNAYTMALYRFTFSKTENETWHGLGAGIGYNYLIFDTIILNPYFLMFIENQSPVTISLTGTTGLFF